MSLFHFNRYRFIADKMLAGQLKKQSCTHTHNPHIDLLIEMQLSTETTTESLFGLGKFMLSFIRFLCTWLFDIELHMHMQHTHVRKQ